MITLRTFLALATGTDGSLLLAVDDTPFNRIVIDSRLVSHGDLFVALPGERVDGHRFVPDALRNGARAALVRADWASAAGAQLDLPIIRGAADLANAAGVGQLLIAVPDPLTTLQAVARAYRQGNAAAVVGITGSVGKTTTKEVLAGVLRQRFHTLSSVKSYNNEIGVPLTLLRLEPTHQVAVIEMGTYGPGDINLLCDWAHPAYAIVTNVGVSHLERMRTPDVVAAAKSELPRALPPHGAAILNYDDQRVRAMAGVTDARVIYYGLDPAADVWADEIVSHGLEGIACRVNTHDEQHRLQIPLRGRHHVYTVLATVALARELGMDWDAIAAGLCDQQIQQRVTVVPAVNGATILDDTYNAAPVSCQAALELLAELPGRHLAALGDMAELGPIEESGHRDVGVMAARVVDLLVVVGSKARWIGEAAAATQPGLPVIYAASNAEAATALRDLLQPGDLLLVKGGRVAATEEIVGALAMEK